MKKRIDLLRKRIDTIDSKIIGLLKKRFRTVKAVGRLKKRTGISIKDTAREKIILKRIEHLSSNEGESRYLSMIYQNILYLSRSLEEEDKTRVV